MNKNKHSALYQYIESVQGERPWGRVLDAGTGENSLSWMTDLDTVAWTAITGSEVEANRVLSSVGDKFRPQDSLLVGNWADPQLLNGESFDTVVADYLLGAVEGFAPFFQPYLFKRLHAHVRERLYVTGLEPYVPTAKPKDAAGQILWEIGRFRDACILLKGSVPYREYPAPWVVEHLKLSGFKVFDVKHFTIGYRKTFVNAQLQIATYGLDTLVNATQAASLKDQAQTLKDRAYEYIDEHGALRYCRNYVISADIIGQKQ